MLLPVIFEDQSIEKLYVITAPLASKELGHELISIGATCREMLSKKKGSTSRQPFTWKLSAIATQMAANRLPMVIQLQFFTQVFYYVGSQLWNTLLERPELCTCNFGFHLKYAVSELRSWYLLRLIPSRPAHIPNLRLTPLACNRINTQNLHDENFHPSQQLNRILVSRTRTHARTTHVCV